MNFPGVPEASAKEAACRIRPCPPSSAKTTNALTAYSVVRFAAIILMVKPPPPVHKLGAWAILLNLSPGRADHLGRPMVSSFFFNTTIGRWGPSTLPSS